MADVLTSTSVNVMQDGLGLVVLFLIAQVLISALEMEHVLRLINASVTLVTVEMDALILLIAICWLIAVITGPVSVRTGKILPAG